MLIGKSWFPGHSTSLSGGSLVEGLPPARLNTEAVEGPHGGLGPAPIDALDLRKLKNERKSVLTLPEGSVGVLDCIVSLPMS